MTHSFLFKSGTISLLALLLSSGCGSDETAATGGDGGSGAGISTEAGGASSGGATNDVAPTVTAMAPMDGAMDVTLNSNVTATFSEAMDPASITDATFVLRRGNDVIPASVSYAGTVATLGPAANLASNSLFTVTVNTGATDLGGNPLAADETWTFETGTRVAIGPAPVSLGTAGNFVILAKSGIDTVPTSALTGDIGVSPIDGTALTGFSLTMDSTNTFATSSQITGSAFAADYTSPTPSNLTTAVGNMEAAFTDAAGRPTPDFTELASGDLSGLTLVPGLYKWGTGVMISSDVTLSGGPDDVWIFQISGDFTIAADAQVILAGGAHPSNIFWQAFGAVALNTTSHLEGIVLSLTEITLATGASVNGRLLSQTAVTLDASTVTQPSL